MRTRHILNMLLIAGTLSIASSGCGSSGGPDTNDDSHPGGETGGHVAAGQGGQSSISGSTEGTGGAAKGGTSNSGGGAGEGKTEASGGAPAVGKGGATGTGGAGVGTGTGGRNGGGGGRKTDGGVAGSFGSTGGGSGKGGASGTGGASGRAGGSGTGGAGSGTDAGTGTKDSGTTGRGGGGNGGGTCTASKDAGKSASGTGPHKVVVESNTDSGVSCGTIYRPSDLGGAEKYPIFVWGEGGCARSGTSNQASMAEIASHGYFVIADGPVGSGGNCPSISMSNDVEGMAKVMIGYINWAIAENDKSCSAYYQSLDTTKLAADGFSCGGLMAEGTAPDPRMTAVGITSSGMTSAVASFYKKVHTPFKILLGGSGDVAYENGKRDFDQISAIGIPTLLLSKDGAGHGGDLSRGTGDFNSVNLAWLNWQLKGDLGATGKGALVGASCKYCNGNGWEYNSKNIE